MMTMTIADDDADDDDEDGGYDDDCYCYNDTCIFTFMIMAELVAAMTTTRRHAHGRCLVGWFGSAAPLVAVHGCCYVMTVFRNLGLIICDVPCCH
jgi:hypothetical protein